MAAAGRGRDAEVSALLANGADVRLTSHDGSTAAAWAAKCAPHCCLLCRCSEKKIWNMPSTTRQSMSEQPAGVCRLHALHAAAFALALAAGAVLLHVVIVGCMRLRRSWSDRG